MRKLLIPYNVVWKGIHEFPFKCQVDIIKLGIVLLASHPRVMLANGRKCICSGQELSTPLEGVGPELDSLQQTSIKRKDSTGFPKNSVDCSENHPLDTF